MPSILHHIETLQSAPNQGFFWLTRWPWAWLGGLAQHLLASPGGWLSSHAGLCNECMLDSQWQGYEVVFYVMMGGFYGNNDRVLIWRDGLGTKLWPVRCDWNTTGQVPKLCRGGSIWWVHNCWKLLCWAWSCSAYMLSCCLWCCHYTTTSCLTKVFCTMTSWVHLFPAQPGALMHSISTRLLGWECAR